MYEITKADWKLYREKLPQWQEAYIERLNQEYIELLTGDDKGSEKWWKLEKRIRQDKKSPGVIVEIRKSEAPWQLLSLLAKGVITAEDLNGFSDDLRERVLYLYKKHLSDDESEE